MISLLLKSIDAHSLPTEHRRSPSGSFIFVGHFTDGTFPSRFVVAVAAGVLENQLVQWGDPLNPLSPVASFSLSQARASSQDPRNYGFSWNLSACCKIFRGTAYFHRNMGAFFE